MRWLVILLVACGSSSSTEPPKEPPKPEPAKPEPAKPEKPKAPPTKPDAPKPEPPKPETSAQLGLTAVMDGKPITVHSVLAANDSDGQVQLHLYNYPFTCADFKSSMRSSELTDLDLTLRTGRYLHPDGTLGWAVRGTYWHPKVEKGTLTLQSEKEDGGDPFPPTAIVDGSEGKTFEVPLAIEVKSNEEEKKGHSLSIRGTAKVTGCGDEKLKRDKAPPPPQPGALIVIAKQEIPISGAAFMVKRDGSRTLEIATHEVVCVEGSDYTSSKWPDIEIEVEWNKQGKLVSTKRGGAWVGFGSGTGEGFKISPNMARGKDATFTLGGATKIGDYPVELKGKVKAIVCPTPK